MSSRTATIADLRAHISKVAPMRTGAPPIATGIPPLDAHIQGWPCPGLVSIHGAAGTGRLGLVLPALQTHTHAQRMVAIVDPLGWLYPPGLPGLHLQHLMLVRCGSERAAWATAQLASSGAVPLIVLLDPPRLGRDAHRMIRATEAGQSTVAILTERPDPDLCTPVRIRTLGQKQVHIERGAPTQPVITL